MKVLRVFAVAVFASLGLALAACSSSPESRGTGQVVDDAGLTARVKTAIGREAGLGTATNVNVTTYRGVVQLSGFVDSQQVADRAAEVARSVDGVKSVQNDLRVAAKR